jgi:hypothetical protein
MAGEAGVKLSSSAKPEIDTAKNNAKTKGKKANFTMVDFEKIWDKKLNFILEFGLLFFIFWKNYLKNIGGLVSNFAS